LGKKKEIAARRKLSNNKNTPKHFKVLNFKKDSIDAF